jgi:hypothetical protein
MDDEIKIKTGQLVTVWEKCGDWFRGEASGRYGLFPGDYVQKAEDTGGDLTYIDMFFNEYEMQVARNTSDVQIIL